MSCTTANHRHMDAACKRVLSEKSILAWIMKSCLDGYRDCSIQEIAEKYIEGQPQVGEIPVLPDAVPRIHGLDTEDKSTAEGTVLYDVRFRAAAPSDSTPIGLIINRTNTTPGIPWSSVAYTKIAAVIQAVK